MNFNKINDKEYEKQLKYFNDYYGAEFKFNQGTEQILDMINKYSIPGKLIDFGSGSNIYFWLSAYNNVSGVKCVDISKEAFFINEKIRLKELKAKSFEYPLKKYKKTLDEIININIEYYLKDVFNSKEMFPYTANNVAQFGLLGLSKTEKQYFKNFEILFKSLQEGGIFLGANWIFSDSYSRIKGFKNNYMSREMILKMADLNNAKCLYVNLVKIENDINYNYVLIYAIKKL